MPGERKSLALKSMHVIEIQLIHVLHVIHTKNYFNFCSVFKVSHGSDAISKSTFIQSSNLRFPLPVSCLKLTHSCLEFCNSPLVVNCFSQIRLLICVFDSKMRLKILAPIPTRFAAMDCEYLATTTSSASSCPRDQASTYVPFSINLDHSNKDSKVQAKIGSRRPPCLNSQRQAFNYEEKDL